MQYYWSQVDNASILPNTYPVGNVVSQVILGESAVDGPALAASTTALYLGWTGTDQRLNVSPNAVNFTGKTTLEERSLVGPALAFAPIGGGRLFMAWAGTDARLNVMSSLDARSFAYKITLEERSSLTPSLTVASIGGGRLFLAWTGTDGRLNVMSSLDGVNFGYKMVLEDRSNAGPTLCTVGSLLYLGFTGTDGRLNLLQSADGLRFGNRVILEERSSTRPAALGGKVVDVNRSFAGPVLMTLGTTLYIAWTGTDTTRRLNLARVITTSLIPV